MKNKIRRLCQGALIAALYVVLTYLSGLFGLSGENVIQLRLSEALCILPCFTPAAIPGLALGCLLANFLTGAVVWDVLLGAAATLLGAVGTYCLRHNRFLAVCPPILSNMIFIPPVLKYAYGFEGNLFYFVLTVGIGEILACGVLGVLLFSILKKYEKQIRW